MACTIDVARIRCVTEDFPGYSPQRQAVQDFPYQISFSDEKHRQTIYIIDSNLKRSHQLTYRLFSQFSVDRYFTFHPLELDKKIDNNTALSPLDWVATNFPLMSPSLKTYLCNLPASWRHVTRPNQGLNSLAPGEGKTRGPWSEVVKTPSRRNTAFGNSSCSPSEQVLGRNSSHLVVLSNKASTNHHLRSSPSPVDLTL